MHTASPIPSRRRGRPPKSRDALGDTRALVLRAGLENIGNVNLAEKSEHFGYAERARRLFVSARVDF